MEFSRQEYWSRLPFPSPGDLPGAGVKPVAAAKSLQSCPTVRPHRRQPTRLPHPWDSPGKNTGVGCHFLLQRMKVKSKSEVAQSCLTLSSLMDCSLPGSSIHGIFQAGVLEWGATAFSESNLGLPHCRQILIVWATLITWGIHCQNQKFMIYGWNLTLPKIFFQQ